VRFLVDESTGPVVAAWLRAEGHDVFAVYEEARGMVDKAGSRRVGFLCGEAAS